LYKDAYPPVLGGIERMIWWVAKRQAARGHQVTILASQPNPKQHPLALSPEETIEGVTIIRLRSFMRPGGTPICPGMTSRLRSLAPDVIHLHHPNPSSDVAYLLAALQTPLVITYHSDVVRQRIRYRMYAPVQQRTLRMARVIMPTSQRYLDSSEQLQPHRDRCVVVPLGVEMAGPDARSPEVQAEASALRASWGPGPVVLSFGVLRYYKGLNFLLDAAAQLPDVRFIIAGQGPERADLERKARNLHVMDRVHFIGAVPEERIPYVHAASDMFVLPSHLRAEAFGLSMVEAMMSGLPVIATDLPTGVPEVNEHERTGLIVPPADVDALTAAIRRLVEDPALRQRLGDAAREKAQSQYTADRMVARIDEVYDRVCAVAR
jgi:rhamnosyl/mannosyltransferase